MMRPAVERFLIVTHDVSDPKRWRRVFNTMKSFGAWLQLSVFQRALSPIRVKRMECALREIIKEGEDHVLIIDLGLRACGECETPFRQLREEFSDLGAQTDHCVGLSFPPGRDRGGTGGLLEE